ncbi:lipoate--protein ligase family protein [Gorillibacterium sp. CAU 1737]|uniref:lipoate--protein ligase family protein n=1 Tax=Gorillibacterium sp. CAU 1737 TaxID=3140362 RepID=UPI003261AD1B
MSSAEEQQERAAESCGGESCAKPYVWPARVEVLDRMDVSADEDIARSFALDELLCRQVGEGRTPVIHLWRHPRAFVMGLRDRRLPQAAEAMKELADEGYCVLVRNSGGAAVPLDAGVVNASIILPNPDRSLAFRQDFRYMVELVKGALAPHGLVVEAGEISGAYCPGDYDLSIRGRKFCGIAQRRQTKAFVVQGFTVVQDSGSMRAERVKAFYDRAVSGSSGSDNASLLQVPLTSSPREPDYPRVQPEVMASLQELGYPGGAEAFAQDVHRWLLEQGETALISDAGLPELQIQAMIEQLRSRYDR